MLRDPVPVSIHRQWSFECPSTSPVPSCSTITMFPIPPHLQAGSFQSFHSSLRPLVRILWWRRDFQACGMRDGHRYIQPPPHFLPLEREDGKLQVVGVGRGRDTPSGPGTKNESLENVHGSLLTSAGKALALTWARKNLPPPRCGSLG